MTFSHAYTCTICKNRCVIDCKRGDKWAVCRKCKGTGRYRRESSHCGECDGWGKRIGQQNCTNEKCIHASWEIPKRKA